MSIHHIKSSGQIKSITETWLTGTDKDNFPIADIQRTLPNYELYHIHRQHCRGGGVGVIVRNGLKVSFNTTLDFQSFEYMDMHISSGSTAFHLVIIYRPKPNSKNKLTPSLFFDEFTTLLESMCAILLLITCL